MKVLHYFLGFPPYRTGGLTKYCVDLMDAQQKNGDTVIALWPGSRGYLNKKLHHIRKRTSINGVLNYEIINPLPVSLDEGINDFRSFTEECDIRIYEKFLKEVGPDAVHIHTLMGLHKEFIYALNKLGIRSVFTTHDYFGICPKVTMYRYGEACQDDCEGKSCIQCNVNALSLQKIQIMQSPLYRSLKNSLLVRMLRKKHRGEFFLNEEIPQLDPKCDVERMAAMYQSLRAYYMEILNGVDVIHFNSTVAESVYRRFMTPRDGRVISITHKDIADNRDSYEWVPDSRLRITCLAPAKPFKGYNVLRDALDSIWQEENHNIELRMFGDNSDTAPYLKVEQNFHHGRLLEIMSQTDVLIAPSVWFETFGFTVLEALSYGVPVIVSDRVGAKDIIGNGGIIVEAGSAESLRAAIESLTQERLIELRKNVKKSVRIKTWDEFVRENYSLYQN